MVSMVTVVVALLEILSTTLFLSDISVTCSNPFRTPADFLLAAVKQRETRFTAGGGEMSYLQPKSWGVAGFPSFVTCRNKLDFPMASV